MPGIFFNEQSRFNDRPSEHAALAAVRQFIAVLRGLADVSPTIWLSLGSDKLADFALDTTANPVRMSDVLKGPEFQDHWRFLLDLLDKAPPAQAGILSDHIDWNGIEYLHDQRSVIGLGAAEFNDGVAVSLSSGSSLGASVDILRRTLSEDGESVLETPLKARQVSCQADMDHLSQWLKDTQVPQKIEVLANTTIYVEGGGDDHALRTECQNAFKTLLENAQIPKNRFKVKACGGRSNTYRAYVKALTRGDVPCVLLVDSESPVTTEQPWTHLGTRVGDEWDCPDSANTDDCHLMTQCMEMWLIADPSTLAEFFGGGFSPAKLPKADLERVAKDVLYEALAQATKNCKTKSQYGKGAHSFKILQRVNPQNIAAASPWAKRFFERMHLLTRT